MKNKQEELQEKADFIRDSLREDGVVVKPKKEILKENWEIADKITVRWKDDTKEYNRQYAYWFRRKYPEKALETNKKDRKRHREQRNGYFREYNKNYRGDIKKVVARRKAYKLENPNKCQGCGVNDSEAHHEDYGKPTEVDWLCKSCHGIRHRTVTV